MQNEDNGNNLNKKSHAFLKDVDGGTILDELVIVIANVGRNSGGNVVIPLWTIFGRDSGRNPAFWTK